MRRLLAVVGLLAAMACSERGEVLTAEQRGEQIYRNVCTTCHGITPDRAGVLGPAVAGASRELLEAKLLRGEYPPGYQPQRATKTMPPLPHLRDHIGDLAAYLQAASTPAGAGS